jgi:hypothetical protein
MRIKISKDRKRGEQVNFRLLPQERQTLFAYARSEGVTVASVIRGALEPILSPKLLSSKSVDTQSV